MGRIKIPYVERDGILYPVLTIPKDMELSAVGKYGLLWLSYMKENHKQRYRTLARLGCINSQAHEVNEEAYADFQDAWQKGFAKGWEIIQKDETLQNVKNIIDLQKLFKEKGFVKKRYE